MVRLLTLFRYGCTTLGIALLLTTASTAQESPSRPGLPPDRLESLLESGFGIEARGSGSWITAGADYRARFDSRGVRFTPALGPDAPRSMPIELRLREVRRGSETRLEPRPVDPRQLGELVLFEHADGIVERYAVSAQGIELSFVFPEPLEGSGDLEIELELATELEAIAGRTARDPLRLEVGNFGGVQIGTVTAIDQTGRSVPGELHTDGDSLTLSIPAGFVDEALYPLVVDPFIGTLFPLTSINANSTNPDVAYDFGNDMFLVVWQRTYSANDNDIYAIRVRSQAPTVPLRLLDTALVDARAPTVACCWASQRFFVAWQERATSATPWQIRGRAFDATDGALSNTIDVSSTFTLVEGTQPDSGGSSVQNRVVVVWNEEGDIVGNRVTVPASGDPSRVIGNQKTIVGLGGFSAPAISKSSGGIDRYLVAFERTTSSPTLEVDIWGAVVDSNVNTLAPAQTLANVQGAYETAPDVDGDGEDFVMAWTIDKNPGGATDRDIQAQQYHYDSGSIFHATPSFDVRTPGDQFAPVVADAVTKYLVAWSEALSSSPAGAVGLNAICKGSASLCEVDRFLTSTSWFAGSFKAIAAKFAAFSLSKNDEALLVFQGVDRQNFVDGVIYAQRLEAIGAGGPVIDLGGGCGGGGTLSTLGSLAIANPDFELRLQGASPVGAPALFLFNFGPPVFSSCGPCFSDLRSDFRINRVVGSGGFVSIPLPLPADPTLFGVAGTAQAILFNSPGPCTRYPQLSNSNRIHMTMGF